MRSHSSIKTFKDYTELKSCGFISYLLISKKVYYFFLCIDCYFGDDYVNLVAGGQRRISSLKAGDRVWTLSKDGKRLIEDEIMFIPHAGPNTPSLYSLRFR